MIKSVFKVCFTIFFVLAAVYSFNRDVQYKSWGEYTPIIINSESELNSAVESLNNLGFKEIVYKNNVTIPINNYEEFEEVKIDDLYNRLDKKDFRVDPYFDNVFNLFSTNNSSNLIYVKMDSGDLLQTYNIYNGLTESAISFEFGDPKYIRGILNIISMALLLLLFSIGSKTRFLLSVITGVLAFFFMDIFSFYSYIGFISSYFIGIMLLEAISFSNRYIKRNNIGWFRILIGLIFFISPSVIPLFIDLSTEVNMPKASVTDGFNYQNLEDFFTSDESNISGLFSHYSYEKSFLYGYEYLFPSYKNSVTINEFNKEEYYLSSEEKVVFTYDEDYLNSFLDYCETTVLGRFFINYGRPFSLEKNSLLSLYVQENEFMYLFVLFFSMFIASFFFKKGRDKKLKY